MGPLETRLHVVVPDLRGQRLKEYLPRYVTPAKTQVEERES